MKRLGYLPLAALVAWPLVLGLAIWAERPAHGEPAWGSNCLSCHGVVQAGVVTLLGYDAIEDPDESGTGAPDRGPLPVFEVQRGAARLIELEVAELTTNDAYAVELTRWRAPGVVNGGRLDYSGDCGWAEWGNHANYFTDPHIARQWTGTTQYAFELNVHATADIDYYDVVAAVAGRHPATNELFYSDRRFYVRVVLRPGDMDCNGTVDFDDINPFVLALTNATAYGQQYPNCDRDAADLNGDGFVNGSDINPFVQLLTGGEP